MARDRCTVLTGTDFRRYRNKSSLDVNPNTSISEHVQHVKLNHSSCAADQSFQMLVSLLPYSCITLLKFSWSVYPSVRTPVTLLENFMVTFYFHVTSFSLRCHRFSTHIKTVSMERIHEQQQVSASSVLSSVCKSCCCVFFVCLFFCLYFL